MACLAALPPAPCLAVLGLGLCSLLCCTLGCCGAWLLWSALPCATWSALPCALASLLLVACGVGV